MKHNFQFESELFELLKMNPDGQVRPTLKYVDQTDRSSRTIKVNCRPFCSGRSKIHLRFQMEFIDILYLFSLINGASEVIYLSD